MIKLSLDQKWLYGKVKKVMKCNVQTNNAWIWRIISFYGPFLQHIWRARQKERSIQWTSEHRMCSQWILGVIETHFPKYQSIKDCYYHKVNNILSEFNQCSAIQKLSLLLVRRWMCRVRFIASCHILRDKQAWEKNNKWMCCWKWSLWHTWWTGHKEHWDFSQWIDQVVKTKLVTNGFREKVLILSGRLICSTGRVV